MSLHYRQSCNYSFFFFNDTATTEIYTLSLHDALPICGLATAAVATIGHEMLLVHERGLVPGMLWGVESLMPPDRKSTRLNSSHGYISYAVFCLKKKKKRE